jgi:hypothetical protein
MKLTVIQNSIDLTLKMDNLAGPVKTVDLTTGEICLGFHKPITAIYIELTETSPGSVPTLDLKYYNGSTYVAVPNIEDRTFGLTKCGFVLWDNADITEEVSTISSREMFWYKLTTSSPASVDIKGINLVLSDDKDLSFVPDILDYLPDTLATWIGFHQEAMKIIVQDIRNSGAKIQGCADLVAKSVDQFDLLDIDEFKQASKYKALELIFDFISKDNKEDRFANKSAGYATRYEASLNSRLISIDKDNDGHKDSDESQALRTVQVVRQ